MAERAFHVAGRDDRGRSAVIETRTIEPFQPSANLIDAVRADGQISAPPESSPATFLDLAAYGIDCPPGTVSWAVYSQAPGEEHPLHYTATVDFDFVVRGSTKLILEADEIELAPGDCVAIMGVAHGWRAGRDGCELSNIVVGQVVAG